MQQDLLTKKCKEFLKSAQKVLSKKKKLTLNPSNNGGKPKNETKTK